MKFVKGLVVGGIVSAGAIMMLKEMNSNSKMMNSKQMLKKGKQYAKKLGII